MNPDKRVVPNVALRLFNREVAGHRGHPVHTARSFSECILPTEKVLEVESPDAHIGRFTPDGRFLVCFSLQLQAVILYDYLGPVPQPHPNPNEPIGFNRFFKERWRLNLCHGVELLNRDFCLTLRNGVYLLLASSSPVNREGPTAAAAAAAGGVPADTGTPTAAGAAAAAFDRQQQQQANGQHDQQHQQQGVVGTVAEAAAAAAVGGPRGLRAASGDWCEMTTFHVVDIQRCIKVDERKFPSDYFELAGNGCASLYDNILAITSLYTQTIHLLQVTPEGTLIDMQSIGRQCQADDALPLQLAAAAEQQWQQQEQQRRLKAQQDRIEAASQQQLFVHMSHMQRQQQQDHEQHGSERQQLLLPTGVNAASDSQQIQQQLLQRVTHPNSLWGQAAAAAIGAAAGSSGATVGVPPAAVVAAAARHGSRTDNESSDEEMDRRERRRRVPAAARQQQQQSADPPGAGTAHIQQQQVAAHGPPTQATAAAAAAAASAAVLDPQQQLIEGIQQRLLAYVYKAILDKQPNEVAPSMWDFQYNFGALSALVIFRARLLDRRHLLLKLAAPTAGPASGAELNPGRMHFFAVYDIVSTRFDGFWKASNAKLLTAVMAQPAQLLPAGRDLSAWDRCSATALYPPGYPLDSGSSKRTQTTDDEQQLGSSRSGTSSAAAAAGRSSNGAGSSRSGDPAAGTRAAVGSSAAELIEAGSSKAARDRLKLLRQVVLLVLPGLQNLSSSPYLDPHLFTYSKHISPIMGLRNSPTESLQFRLAKHYAGFEPSMTAASAAASAGVGAGRDQQQHEERLSIDVDNRPGPRQSRRRSTNAGRRGQQQQGVVFELDPARPHCVMWGNEEVARRQLHLFHPCDPFVLTVVQTIAQPAAISILYRS